jgi:acetyl esterase/lipase
VAWEYADSRRSSPPRVAADLRWSRASAHHYNSRGCRSHGPLQSTVRLHEALNKAGVPNQLITIPGGKHGGFSHDETVRAYTAIREFLIKHGVMKATGSPSMDKTAGQAQVK